MDESASSVMVSDYNGVALEGNSVSFACSSGFLLTGPNSSTCIGNRKWEPDPMARRSACHKNHHHNNNICRSLLDHKALLGVHSVTLCMWSLRLLSRKNHNVIIILLCSYD